MSYLTYVEVNVPAFPDNPALVQLPNGHGQFTSRSGSLSAGPTWTGTARPPLYSPEALVLR